MMNYIIGVDAGGTKTEAIAYSLEDQELGIGLSGYGNLYMNYDKATEHIIQAIEQCRINACGQGAEECLGIYLGIAGIEVQDYAAKIDALLTNQYHCRVCGLHDSVLAHAAILGGEDGIVTLSGTGSVAFGLYKGKHATTGGWGHVLGDEGSGYHIALQAFKRMTLEEDLGLQRSRLSQTLFKNLHLDKVNDLKGFVHSADKGKIAAYAAMVAELAEASDEVSMEILKQAGKDLALMTQRLYPKLGIHEPVPVGVSGSILEQIHIVRHEFKHCLEREVGLTDLIINQVSVTKGACYLHKKETRCE
ncbi:MAG TPA: ATPase [Peptococcaceae bacterium]|nr:ATPase [Peptococcaceae bacterium]